MEEVEVSSREDSASEFCCVVSIFFNELVGICKQGNEALINCFGRSVQEYFAFSLFRIDLWLRSVNTEKTKGNILLH